MHGLIGLIIFGVIAFFVIRAMFFSGRSAVGVPVRQTTPPYSTTGPDDDADGDDPEMRELEELERQEREAHRRGVPARPQTAANAFAALGLPKGLGGVLGSIASVAAVGALAAVTDGDVDFDLPDFKKRITKAATEAKLTGEPLDLKAVIAQVTGAVEAASATTGGSKKRPHAVAQRSPSGDDVGHVFGVRPPLDARGPLAPLGPANVLAPFHPVKVLAERAPISV